MAIEFKLPELGENITSGDVVSVLVKEGDEIEANQGVVELETDKAVIEVPAPQAGRVAKVHVQKKQTVKVGEPLITIEAGEEKAEEKEQPKEKEKEPAKAGEKEKEQEKESKKPSEKPRAEAKQEAEQEKKSEPRPEEQSEESLTPVKQPHKQAPPVSTVSARAAADGGAPAALAPAGPAVRRFARELGVDLHRVTGTGAGGRITREDVMTAVRDLQAGGPAVSEKPAMKAVGGEGEEGQDAYGKLRREPLSKIRKTIAANMARSHSTIPHVTNFDDADITELERIRKGSMADYVDKQVKLTMMAFVMKAVAHALKLHPAVNALLDLEKGDAVYKQYVNLGVAVDTDRGLVVPVMRNVDRMSIPQIAQGLTKLAEQARNNQFSLDDLRGGTFTISNLGAIGGAYSTPIINYPEVAILLLGRSRKLPVVMDDDTVQPRLMMPLSLSYDHRWIDGATAARFLNEVIGFLEVPGRLLLAP